MRSFFAQFPRPAIYGWIVLAVCSLGGACTVESSTSANTNSQVNAPAAAPANSVVEAQPKGATIPIEPNGPADTVRVFYKHLREKRFRDAIFLTNLRPAIEGLTETELNDFALDFAALAGRVPAEIEINGEVVSGDKATVTANLPGDEGKNEIQSLQLRKINDVWIIQTADDEASQRIRKEGKAYFYNLRIETHEHEARKMLERVSKAQVAHSLQNNGAFSDMGSLVAAGLLPDDIRSSESTGYVYAVDLAPDSKSYTASAVPAVYGKSGRQSFILKLDNKGIAHVSGKDNGGKPLAK